MARQTSKLNTLAVQRATKPGKYADGGGLYLQVSSNETKSWIFRFMLNGQAREMGLGPVALVSLADARTKTTECRKLLLEGIDPIQMREEKKRLQQLETAKSFTFDQCAAAYIASHRAGWKNAKHAAQWTSSIETYASPFLGKLSVQSIDTALIMRVLSPIWQEKSETASRVRSRIELVLGWATASGYRVGDNPARWRGHLENLLPKRSSMQQVEHHAALPVSEIGNFMVRLAAEDGIASRALEFLILTATRTGETLGAQWCEIDFEENTWTIPAIRMKAKKEHRVPLSGHAIQVLQTIRESSSGPYAFSAKSGQRPLSNMAMLAVLRRMEVNVTAHGFRSTFRDWAAERTNFSREVAEAALAHSLKDKVEAAYRRGDLFLKRHKLMSDWAKFCAVTTQAVSVTQLRTPKFVRAEAMI